MDTSSAQLQERRLIGRLHQPQWYWPLAGMFAAFYVVTSLYIAAHRLLWFDEILTALISRMPNFRTMWTALSEGVDQSPPLYFLITRTFDQIFRFGDLSLRLPSALGLGAALLITFDTARRFTNSIYGLISIPLLATSFVSYYGYEARGYGLYLMLAAIALWLWVSTAAESRTAAAMFGLVFLIGSSIHYYFLLCLLPLAIVALAKRRVFELKILAGATGILLAVAISSRQVAQSRVVANSFSPVWKPSVISLLDIYLNFVPVQVLIVALLAMFVARVRRPRKRSALPVSVGERVSWLFLFVPCAAYLLGIVVTHAFHSRYVIGAAPAIAVGSSCLLWRRCQHSSRLSAALLIAFCTLSIGQQVYTLKNIGHIATDSDDYQERTRQALALEDTLLREGKQHVVFNSDVQYLETWYYSKHPDSYECITDEDRWGITKYVPLHFVSIQEIVSNARQTALVDPSDSLTDALARAGLRLKIRSTDAPRVVYLE